MKNVKDGDIDGMPEVTEEMRSNGVSSGVRSIIDWSDMRAYGSILDKGEVGLDGGVSVHQNGLIIQYIMALEHDDDPGGAIIEYQITNTNARYIKVTGELGTRVEIEPVPDDGMDYWRSFQPSDGGSRWDTKHPAHCRLCRAVARNVKLMKSKEVE